jgi:hypothetical protein
MLDFSQRYSQLAHQSQKTGLPAHHMPNFAEIDALIKENATARQSLQRLRDVVMTQQIALAESSREQAKQPVHDDLDGADTYADESKDAGYMGGDAKKRRGVRKHRLQSRDC